MRRAGARVALQFRDKHKDDQGAAPEQQEVDANQYRLEEGDGATHAQRIVRELYLRYEKQLQRGRDYRNLFVFLAFVALFLAVLYLQRSANVAYQVHSTLEDVLVPKETTMKSTTEVYEWLRTTLDAVWVDPTCGDGICEAPWEFASYSRFGCRADCGKLQDLPNMNLTKIQLDLQWDFSHPIGSIPASDLMQQASVNICPLVTSYANACYMETAMTFERLSGSTSFPIQDAPDGVWNALMQRDIFMKVDGAVRDTKQVYAMAYYYKVYVAARSILEEHQFELNLLQEADRQGQKTFWTHVNDTLQLSNSSALLAHATLNPLQQLVNASCGCMEVPINGTSLTFWGSDAYIALNNTRDGSMVALPNGTFVNMTMSQYEGRYCDAPSGPNSVGVPQPVAPYTFNRAGSGGVAKPEFWELINIVNGNTTTNFTNASSTNCHTFNNITWCQSGNETAWCMAQQTALLNWRTNFTSTMQKLLIDRRLGDQRSSGKLVQRNNALANMRLHIRNKNSELFEPVFTSPRGSLASDPLMARVDVLQEFYATGPSTFNQPQLAGQGLTRRIVYSPSARMDDLSARSKLRMAEVQGFIADLRANVTVPPSLSPRYPTLTMNELLNYFNASGATNATLPDPSDMGLGPLTTKYNLASWRGNNTAYLTCNLDNRGAEFVGVCKDMPTTCVITANDTAPYNCTRIPSGVNITGAAGLPWISDPAYYNDCVLPCDHMLDCHNSTICECYGACGSNQYCECDACGLSLGYPNAVQDPDFLGIATVMQNQSQLAMIPTLPDLVSSMNGGGSTGRKLQQDVSADLQGVLKQIGTVKEQQDKISSQMTKLQGQVDLANTLAEKRANDMRLVDLISAGRQDIKSGQASMEAKLDELIGKQNQALATAEQAAKALDAIQGLAQKQVAAQQALERAVANQLAAIKTAASQSIISITQALALWKRSRRDKALTLKSAKLANIPCNSNPSSDNVFQLDNGNAVNLTTPRERNVGLTNRVIAGMLLHQHRTNDTNCTESKFSKIQQTCTGPTTLKSYGVDPVFKRGTQLYNPNYDDPAHLIVTKYYNCSQLDSPTYNITFQNVTVNPAPYCAELYNPQQLPYSFYHFPLDGKEPGFPVYFDINLGANDADTWRNYLEQGLYLDMHTSVMTAEMVTYNAPLRIFGYFYIEFYFHEGGSIKVTHRLQTVRVELYNGYSDDVRFGFEILLTIWICGLLLFTFWRIIWTQKTERNFLRFFLKGWNIVDFISNGLLFSCIVIWWIFVTDYAKTFDIMLRYDVYASLTPDANYLALSGNGQGLSDVWAAIKSLRELNDMLNWYFALNGINILLLIARVLKLMDFQPRLGVVTRSLWLAGPDLIHFAIVAGMVFVGYAMMAHLIFGNAIESFATFGDSVNTCFEILLGNIDVNDELRALGGLQSVAGALFFWSYVLLVFMVLLNFLLAIIVDAFSEVKEKTHETVGIHTELYQLMRDKWRSLMGRCSKNYISDAKLGSLLKTWAGQDEDEKEQKRAEVEMQKLLTVLNEDLDEEDLRTILMECLKDAPGAGQEEDKAGKKGLLGKCLPGRKPVVATAPEVALAAKYIVDRFGVPVEAEEAMEAEEAAGDAQERSAMQDAALEKERDQLASALERLAEVQRELADGQRNLMVGQRQLAEQQAKLVTLMASEPRSD